MDIILQNVWTTPSVIATEVRRLYPDVLTNQIYYAWKKACQELWMKDAADQLKSASMLLDEMDDRVERFNIPPIDGVQALAYGLTSVASHVKDVVEVAMDATCESSIG